MRQGYNYFPEAADALGFPAPQGRLPEAVAPDLHEYVAVMQVTAAAPFDLDTRLTLDGGEVRGRYMPGVHEYRDALEDQPQLQVVRNADDIEVVCQSRTGADKKTGMVLSLQQAPHDVTPGGLAELHTAGIRVMALGYKEGSERFGSGWMAPEGRLTNDGKDLLHAMADYGIGLDLSHSGHQTAEDALTFIEDQELELPVMASHGGIYEAFDGNADNINNFRNLRLETLKRIDALKGVVGIYALTFGLSEYDNSDEPLYEQLQFAATELPNSLVIGSDAVYQERDESEAGEWYHTYQFLESRIAAGTEMEVRFPDTPFELNTPARLQVIGNRLLQDGMPHEQTARVIGGTLLDFYSRSIK